MKTIYLVYDKLMLPAGDRWEWHFEQLFINYIERNSLEVRVVKIDDPNELKSLILGKKILATDMVVFPNAWTDLTIKMRHWAEQTRSKFKTVGLWSYGCFVGQGHEFRPLKNRDWRKVTERAYFRCLDRSYFISEFYKENFRIYVSKLVFPTRLKISRFPLSYLREELAPYAERYFKKDLIIFPWHRYSRVQHNIIYDFIRHFRYSKLLLFPQENDVIPRKHLLAQTAQSKVAFLPYSFPNIGKEIYECLLLGTIPVIPEREYFKDFIPAEFQYPPEWTSTMIEYTRYAPEITSKINDLVDNYKSYLPLIAETLNKMENLFIDRDEIFKELIEYLN